MNLIPQWIGGPGAVEPLHQSVDHGMTPEELRAAALAQEREESERRSAWQSEWKEDADRRNDAFEAEQREKLEAQRAAQLERAKAEAIIVERERIAQERNRAEFAEARRIEREVLRAELARHPATRLKNAEATIADLVAQVAALRDRVLVLEGEDGAVTKTEDGKGAKA